MTTAKDAVAIFTASVPLSDTTQTNLIPKKQNLQQLDKKNWYLASEIFPKKERKKRKKNSNNKNNPNSPPLIHLTPNINPESQKNRKKNQPF